MARPSTGLISTTVLLATCASAGLSGQDLQGAAHFRDGRLPNIPVQAVSGGHVFAELTISGDGDVSDVKVLRTTPPFTQEVVNAVKGWQFVPAEDDSSGGEPRRVVSTVLLAGVFRPPALFGPTLGDPPRDLAPASAQTPFPTAVVVPPYPPRALEQGLVLIEAQVDDTGRVLKAKVVRSAPPFDQAALDAARQWMFRPGEADGQPAATVVYLLLGFRQPIT